MTKKRKAASPLQASPAPRSAAAADNNSSREIGKLREEVGELQRRIAQLEDGMEQRDRLGNLLFSGPAIPEAVQGEKSDELIQDLISTHLSYAIDLGQVHAAFRVRNQAIMVKFKSALPGSDRDQLFRTKKKLPGTGLFINESLTRKRQELFRELLRLKKGRSIHAVYTQAGDLFVRHQKQHRSRYSIS